jgi:hypothetical protein
MTLHNPTDKSLWLMGSPNGKDFCFVSDSELFPADTDQRDPVMIYTSSKWWICYTFAPAYFVVINSSDLTTWNFVANVDMSSITGVTSVWAPQWFIDSDGSAHVFVAIDTGGDTTTFQIYHVQPTNAAMTTWSAPSPITITGKSNVIDPFMVYKSGTYYLWYKQENDDYLEYATSSTLTGTFTPIKEGDWAGWGHPNENPCLYQLDNGNWRIIFQEHSGFDPVNEWYSDSSDDWATWSAKTALGYCNYIPGGPSIVKRTW